MLYQIRNDCLNLYNIFNKKHIKSIRSFFFKICKLFDINLFIQFEFEKDNNNVAIMNFIIIFNNENENELLYHNFDHFRINFEIINFN